MSTESSSSIVEVVTLLLAIGTVTAVAQVPGAAEAGATRDCGSLFDREGSRLYLPAETSTVTGDSLWAPDEDASLVIRFYGSPGVVLRNESVDIDEHGSWEATVDLSGIEEGRRFVASLHHGGEVVDSVEGAVGTRTATVRFENQTGIQEHRVVVGKAHLEVGGFVAIHRDSARGPILGVSDYLEPGLHSTVTVELDNTFAGTRRLVAMPHMDTDCDGRWGYEGNEPVDGPYWANETPVTDAAAVSFPTPTPSPTMTPTPSATPTATTTPTRFPSPTSTDPSSPTTPATTPTTGPGFGIGVALVVVGATSLLLRRRR